MLRSVLACLGGLLAAGSAVGLASDAGLAVNRVTFQDARGEEAGAPDITTVAVSNGNAGLITFRIDVPSHPVFTDDMSMSVYVDSDNDAATGGRGPAETTGWDYRIFWNRLVTHSQDPRLVRCENTRCLSVPGESVGLRFSYAGGARFTILDAELGNTKRFRFSVSVTTGIVRDPATGRADWDNARWDFAPALGKTWSYDVRLAPERLLVRSFSTTPSMPRAGSAFTVRLAASGSDTGAVLTSGRVTCTASIGRTPLRPRSQGFVGRRAACVFAIPADAKGKTIRGTITIRSQGMQVTRSFTRTIG